MVIVALKFLQDFYLASYFGQETFQYWSQSATWPKPTCALHMVEASHCFFFFFYCWVSHREVINTNLYSLGLNQRGIEPSRSTVSVGDAPSNRPLISTNLNKENSHRRMSNDSTYEYWQCIAEENHYGGSMFIIFHHFIAPWAHLKILCFVAIISQSWLYFQFVRIS